MHCYLKKKRRKAGNGAVLNGIHVFFFPWTREAGEKKKIFLLFHRQLSLKKTPTTHLLATWWKKEGDVPLGRFGAAAQWPPQPRLPPLFLPIKTGKREEKEDGVRERERPRDREGTKKQEPRVHSREEKIEGREEKKKKRRKSREDNEKQRREREGKRRATVGHREPPAPSPAPLPVATSNSANDDSHRRSAPLPFFLLRLLLSCQPPLFT